MVKTASVIQNPNMVQGRPGNEAEQCREDEDEKGFAAVAQNKQHQNESVVEEIQLSRHNIYSHRGEL